MLPNSCDAVLAQGIFDQTRIDSDTTLSQRINEFIYESEFTTHQEALNAGFSLGFAVYGVPLKLDGKFTKEQRDQWKHDHAEYKNDQLTTSQKFSIVISSVDPAIVLAWRQCLEIITTAPGLSARLIANNLDAPVLYVQWLPIEGDTGSDPIVLSSSIIGGARADDRAVAYDPGTKLLQGVNANLVQLKRDRHQDLSITIQTNRAAANAFIPGVIDPPNIRVFALDRASIFVGESSTLTWQVDNVQNVMINPLGQRAASGSQAISFPNAIDQTYTLTATNGGGANVQSAVLHVQQRKSLQSLSIIFDTANDDKDDDTVVDVRIRHRDGNPVLAYYHQDGNKLYTDRSRHEEALNISHPVYDTDMEGAVLEIHIEPHGHDTWRFKWTVVGHWSDGTSFVNDLHDVPLWELTQNNRDADQGLPL